MIVETTKDLHGKRALVTGGTQGIGEAVVKRLTQAGAKVMTAARHIRKDDPSPELFIQADLSTPEGAAKLARAVLERLGGVDILVNSLGGTSSPPGGVLALTDEHWQRDLDLNLLSAVRLAGR